MMAEMLSYLDSKSSAWVLEDSGAKSYPGEYTCHITVVKNEVGIRSQPETF